MMQNTLALNIPQSGRRCRRYRVALIDVISGHAAVDIWGRLGWRETKRRYRRTDVRAVLDDSRLGAIRHHVSAWFGRICGIAIRRSICLI